MGRSDAGRTQAAEALSINQRVLHYNKMKKYGLEGRSG